MIVRLATHLGGCEQEQAASYLLQDVALARLWAEANASLPAHRDTAASIRALTGHWLESHALGDDKTEGRRHQVLLREVLDQVKRHGVDGLEHEEQALLFYVAELAGTANEAAGIRRIYYMLRPVEDALRAAATSRPLDPALPRLCQRIHYATTADLLNAPVRETRMLAGIELPCRGPVYTSPCHLRVIGDVPDKCTVVVENDGHCSIDGYVMGRILARQHCDARGNIAGAVVVLYGDVCARTVINNAFVVSKMGGVRVSGLQSPKLVFAGAQLSITGTMMSGKVIARRLHVAEDIRGGEVHVSELGEARWFRAFGEQPLCIVLRSELTCADYGEVTGSELKRLISQAHSLRSSTRHFESLARIARTDAEHAAHAVLLFLFGATSSQRPYDELATMERRVALVNRILANIHGLFERTTGHWTGTYEAQDVAQDNEPFVLEFEGDEPIDPDLAEQQAEANRIKAELLEAAPDRETKSKLVGALNVQVEKLEEERDDLLRAIASLEKDLQSTESYERVLASAGEDASKLDLLNRVLPAIRKQPPSSPLPMRLQAPFATVAMRTVSRRLKLLHNYESQSQKFRARFQSVSERLGKDFQITMLENPDDDDRMARVIGHFEGGIRIQMDVPDEDARDVDEDRVLVTDDDDVVRTFVRSQNAKLKPLQKQRKSA